jgi:hypothetical protein
LSEWKPIETAPPRTIVEALDGEKVLIGKTASLSPRRPGMPNTITCKDGMRYVVTHWRPR